MNESDVCQHNETDTSIQAFETVKGQTAEMRRRICDYIRTLPSGATCEEVEVALGMKHQTASARVSELLRDGVLGRTSVKRKTSSGCWAWVVAIAEPTA